MYTEERQGALQQTPEGTLNLVAEGRARPRVLSLDTRGPYLRATAEQSPERSGDAAALALRTGEVRRLLEAVVGRLQKLRAEAGVA